MLERALERQPQAELAIALNHAQLQTDRGDTEGATGDPAGDAPSATRITHRPCVSCNACISSEVIWSAVIRLLPELRKDKVLPAAELAELERRAWGGEPVPGGA